MKNEIFRKAKDAQLEEIRLYNLTSCNQKNTVAFRDYVYQSGIHSGMRTVIRDLDLEEEYETYCNNSKVNEKLSEENTYIIAVISNDIFFQDDETINILEQSIRKIKELKKQKN